MPQRKRETWQVPENSGRNAQTSPRPARHRRVRPAPPTRPRCLSIARRKARALALAYSIRAHRKVPLHVDKRIAAMIAALNMLDKSVLLTNSEVSTPLKQAAP